MLAAESSLFDAVQVRPRFLRSVHLERDFNTADSLDGYVPTPSALSALERVARGIAHPTERALSVTGPYGTGKSAWALLVTKTLGVAPFGDAAIRARIAPLVNGGFGSLTEKEGFWPVLVTGGRESVSEALMRALLASFAHLPDKKKTAVFAAIETAVGTTAPMTAQTVTRAFEAVARHVQAHFSGCRGLLIVVDEMGKFLEWASHNPKQGDVQVLQEMAEAAVRSEKAALVFVTILHQAFDEYAHRLGTVQRTEWQKVQGRFSDVPFGDAADETVRLLARAITQTGSLPAAITARIDSVVRDECDRCFALGLLPRSLSATEFYGLARQAYPLHPLTLLVLPSTFKRFGQSERSLFSFLASEEPFGFLSFLRSQSIASHADATLPFLRICDVYDYLIATLGASLYRGGGQGGAVGGAAKLWSETQEALARCEDRAPLDARLIKTVALLHILGEGATRIPASRDVLRCALDDTDPNVVDFALDGLQTATLLTYRPFKKAYRPYEGSDIDVEARLRDARHEFTPGVDAAQTAQKLAAMPPLVARRHLFDTGTLRYFDAVVCRPNTMELAAGGAPEYQTEKIVGGESGRADGVVLLCLATTGEQYEEAQSQNARLFADRTDVIVGIAPETDALREAAIVVECLFWVQNNTPELRNDKIAEREVAERLADAEAAFLSEWERLLLPAQGADEPGNGAAAEVTAWFYQNERVAMRGGRDLQRLVSRACQETYPNTPRLHNELINRRQISSTAAAARRVLLENLLENRKLPLLGMEPDAFPPERSMYAAILQQTGLHQPTGETHDDGRPVWNVAPPFADRDPALSAV